MPDRPQRHKADVLALAALILPTLAAWAYFVGLKGSDVARFVYLGAKVLQFALPIAWLWLARRGVQRATATPWRPGLIPALTFGFAASLGILLVDRWWLAGSPLAVEAGQRIGQTLADFRIETGLGYAAMALALSVVHSLLEEIYWRWFVFQRAAAWLPLPAAIAVASLGFAAHHWIVVARYLPPDLALSLGSAATLAVAATGAVWCWLYRRSGNLLAIWLSHLLVDCALFALGYQLWRG